MIGCLQQRWQASYDLQLVVRRGRLYLQVMWAYLEQQSFPMKRPIGSTSPMLWML